MQSGTPRRLAILILASAGLSTGVLALTTLTRPASVPAAKPVRTIPPITVVRPKPSPTPKATPAPYVIRHVMTLPGPFRHGDHYWDEAGAPAGPVVITIDLQAQVLSVFRNGWEIGTAVILYGANDKPTPLGVFTVTEKDADHVSNLYGAPMPYMLRLTNDGISIHGADVERDKATHGCVGVPTPFAKKLFAAIKLGDRVIVTSGEKLTVGQPVKAASSIPYPSPRA